MGQELTLSLVPTRPDAHPSREAFAGIIELLNHWSDSKLGKTDVEVQLRESVAPPFQRDSVPEAAAYVRRLPWEQVRSLRVTIWDPTELQRLFHPEGAPYVFEDYEDQMCLEWVTIAWDFEEPENVSPGGDHLGLLARCTGCYHDRALTLVQATLVRNQKDRWKCPDCTQVTNVEWADDASALPFTHPFSILFVGGTNPEPAKGRIRRPLFARELDSVLGFPVREWFGWI